jgi:serine O-acetyltransferase
MIRSKEDYLFYLSEDKKSLGKKSKGIVAELKQFFFPDFIWQFQRLMREYEYFNNCKTGVFSKIYRLYLKSKFRKLSLKLGFSIPLNTFGPGLAIVHYGTIVVNGNAKIGANCRIHASTNIGASNGSNKAPQIGENVYIAPGVIIFGDIKIASNTLISANSTVNKTFEIENTMIAGSPAKFIKNIDIGTVFKHIK